MLSFVFKPFYLFAPLFAERESILSFCQRLGHPIDPNRVDADIADGSCTCQAIANAMANTRDNRMAGKTSDDGALVSVSVSAGDWLGYDDANTTAINAMVEALTPLMPVRSALYCKILRYYAFIRYVGFTEPQLVTTKPLVSVFVDSTICCASGGSVFPDIPKLAIKVGPNGFLGWEAGVTLKLSKLTPHVVRPLLYHYASNGKTEFAPHLWPGPFPRNLIAMEWLEPLPDFSGDATMVLQAGLSLFKALSVCHELSPCRVVHGDVCAGNVMMRPGSGEVVLIDFGLSQPIEYAPGYDFLYREIAKMEPDHYPDDDFTHVFPFWSQHRGAIRGHSGSLPPEMLDGSYNPEQIENPLWGVYKDDPAIDVWSAGVVLAEWIVGEKGAVTGGVGVEDVVDDTNEVRQTKRDAKLVCVRDWVGGKGERRVRQAGKEYGWSDVLVDGLVDVMCSVLRLKAENRISSSEAAVKLSALNDLLQE